jgi:hypothetical protein
MHLPTGKITLGSFLSYSKMATQSLNPFEVFDPKAWFKSKNTRFSVRSIESVLRILKIYSSYENHVTQDNPFQSDLTHRGAAHLGQHLL